MYLPERRHTLSLQVLLVKRDIRPEVISTGTLTVANVQDPPKRLNLYILRVGVIINAFVIHFESFTFSSIPAVGWVYTLLALHNSITRIGPLLPGNRLSKVDVISLRGSYTSTALPGSSYSISVPETNHGIHNGGHN